MARAHDIKLKNTQIYDENSEPIWAALEGKIVTKSTFGDVKRLNKGTLQTIDEWYHEITLKISSVNAALKYRILESTQNNQTYIIPMVIGETLDKEGETQERVKMTNIYVNAEELTAWEAKADGNDIATYEIKGRSNEKLIYVDKLPDYSE